MKYFILAATLFLSASVSFAADKFDLNGDNETGFTWNLSDYAGWTNDDPYFSYYYRTDASRAPRDWETDVPMTSGKVDIDYLKENVKQEGGYYSISVAVRRYDLDTDWSYSVYDAKGATDAEWELTADSEYLVNEVEFWDEAHNKFYDKTYYFAIPVGEYDANGNPPIESVAIRVNNGDYGYSSIDNANLFYVADHGLAYGVPLYDKNGFQINKPEAEFTFGQPLPSPIATLLIALGFGAAVMMYRNRRQVKA